MSHNVAYSLLGRISNEPMLVAPDFQGVGSAIRAVMNAESADTDLTQKHLAEVCNIYGGEVTSHKIYGMIGNLAVIPIHGVLINRFSGAWGFVTGYNYIHAAMQDAVADPDVEGIVLDVNSFGGEAQGCMECAQAIYEMRGDKPITAIVDANSYSAGYALASAADRIVVTPSGGAGSIGVVTMHIDFSKALSEFGIQVTFVYAGKHKVDGNPYEPLQKEVKTDIQDRVNQTYEKFVSLVSQNRGLDAGAVRATEARIYTAADALKVGLIDAVAPPPEAIAAFLSELSGSNNREDSEMSTTTAAPGATTDTPEDKNKATAAAPEAPATPETEAATTEQPKQSAEAPAEAPAGTPAADSATERQRVKAILSCDEAKDKPGLANHLAFDTELSVDAAKKALAASAPEKANSNAFEDAMSGSDNPGVGEGDETQPGEQSASKSILQSYSKATGLKFDSK